jgi:hypothetical protein
MREGRPGICARNAGILSRARPGRSARQGRKDALGKTGLMRDVRQDRFGRQGRVDAGGKAGHLR